MATMDHTPRGRGYSQSIHYFHHDNDYWDSDTGTCDTCADHDTRTGHSGSDRDTGTCDAGAGDTCADDDTHTGHADTGVERVHMQ